MFLTCILSFHARSGRTAILSKETQQVLGMSEVVIITERVDNVALLMMGLPKVLDKPCTVGKQLYRLPTISPGRKAGP